MPSRAFTPCNIYSKNWIQTVPYFGITPLTSLHTVNNLEYLTSGNRTPGGRFYSDLLDTSVCIHQLVLKRSSRALGCSQHNCKWLSYGSFQLTHMSRDDHAVQLIEPWRPKRRQNIFIALTTLPQRWVSARKPQYTTAITTMWTESSWTFPESYTADESWNVRSSDGGQRGDKRAHNSTTEVSFCPIIIRLCHCTIAITRV